MRPALLAAFLTLAACSNATAELTAPAPPGETAPPATATPADTSPASTAPQAPSPTAAPQAAEQPEGSPYVRPEWLGTRLLPLRPDDHGVAQPTPPELVDRRLETIDLLPAPAGEDFDFTTGPVPADVLARSSWSPECPIGVDELTYLTMAHYGFDGEYHTGEMIVNAEVADQVVEVFRRLHEARYPIEQMRVITAEEIDAHPTGDGNDTTAFVCRPAVGSESWSQHAFGLAVDINPFHNPYRKGDLVLPELASAYVDRSDVRPGMIVEGDVVVQAFDDIGWGWGGRWQSLDDWMHFSRSGT